MLKPGLVFIGQPSLHLHELLSLALYLEAPMALSDPMSYEIVKKFSEIIPVYKLSEEYSFNFFISGINRLYTNLQPKELEPFFLAHPEASKLEVFHIFEKGIKFYNSPSQKKYCSSFLHTKQFIPLDCEWVNLGAIGYLSFQKHKKAIRKILNPFVPYLKEAKFYVCQILNDCKSEKILSENTLDQIRFINLAFTGFDGDKHTDIIPAHGLLDASLDMSQGGLIYDEAFSLLALNHKKPLLIPTQIKGIYEELSPLTSTLPKEPRNLLPLIENYFDFETINRETLIEKAKRKFYNQALFP
jgi:hypothetical protein